MRRIFGSFLLLSAANVGFGATPVVATEPHEQKTIQLRSGPVTLEPTTSAPTEALPPAPPAEASKDSTRPRTRGITPDGTGGGPKAAESKKQRGSMLISRLLASDRVILSFERRLNNTERLRLAQRGIVIGEFLGETSYTARVTQLGSGQLVRASEGINTIQHVIAFDQANARIKIDPALATRIARPSAAGKPAEPPPGSSDSSSPATRGIGSSASSPIEVSPTRGAETKGQPGTVVVEIWPDADLEASRRELAQIGEIRRVSPKTRKIEVSIANYAAVEAIAKLKGVKFVAPTYGIRTQNTRIGRNIGIEVAREPQHALSGEGVRVGIWDGGHVAANHPSFTGRLAVDLEREGIRRRDDRHATHVAGTIAGSGDYVVPATAGDGRPGRMREIDLPAFGPELTIKTRPARPATTGEASTATGPLARSAATVPAPAKATPVVATEPASDTEPRYPGMAARSQILSYDFLGAAEELIDLLTAKPDAIDVMNNSWGLNVDPATDPTSCQQMAAYAVLDAPDFDAVVAGEKNGQVIRRIPIVFAAGNVRNDGVCGLSSAEGFPNYRTVIPPGTAKNVITVGAIDADSNEMTEFSGWGPTANGRIKPDIVAPGCRALKDGDRGIVSAVPSNTIGRSCGTSMATPAVTGVVALMIEKVVKLRWKKADVFPSTYKALLIHGAEDLGRPGPDFEYGYGRVRLGPTFKLMDDNAFLQGRLEQERQVATLGLTAAAGASEMKVTLVWDDRPTGVFTEEALSNDLDLVVIGPDGREHLPFVLNAVPGKEKEPARPGVDRLNVVEQVIIKQPAAGSWRVEVRATKIGSPTGGQTYSLVTSMQ